MRGLESDLCPPEVVVSREMSKSEPKNKRSRKHVAHEEPPAPPPKLKSDPATVLITQVLPAAAQLHLTTWRSQVCEEIRSIANRIWPKSSGGGGDSSHLRPPAAWQRRLDGEFMPLRAQYLSSSCSAYECCDFTRLFGSSRWTSFPTISCPLCTGAS